MENRRSERTRKRVACSLLAGEARTAGLILDLSANGLFVQTGATLDPGEPVAVEFELPGSSETITLQCRVVRRNSVPARLKSVLKAGLGIEIERAPESFYAWVAELQDVRSSPSTQKPLPRPGASSGQDSTRAAPARPRPAERPRSTQPKPGKALTKSRPRSKLTKPQRPASARASQQPAAASAQAPPQPECKPGAPKSDSKPVLRRLRKRYRVEVHEIEGRGARLIEVEALNVAAATRRALEEVGDGWKVVACEKD